jgi:flagellar protein FlbT
MHISLRAGEKLYINGAVLKVDRKVSLELLNDATFLLEAHVMRPEDATTPLRQLYFIVQIMLMDPNDAGNARAMFERSIQLTVDAFADGEITAGLNAVSTLISLNRPFEALKRIRSLFPFEAAIISDEKLVSPTEAA